MIPIIDLFAGPGGLGEGFSSLVDEDGEPIFQTIMSIEKDPQAHKTLRLRSYFRKIYHLAGHTPKAYAQYIKSPTEENFKLLKDYAPDLWDEAEKEALCAELKDGDFSLVDKGMRRLNEARTNDNSPWVLIGGPPCQAYSLVGRSRRAHDKTLEDDVKQTLYKCYLAFIEKLQPTVFVMENVKGLLSATRKGEGVFERICEDVKAAGYEIRSLVKYKANNPRDFIVEAEKFGIPQMRHRVILLGVKQGCENPNEILSPTKEVTLQQVLEGIPRVRSGFSERNPGWRDMNWAQYIDDAVDRILQTEEGKELSIPLSRVKASHPPKVRSKDKITSNNGVYDKWYRHRLNGRAVLANHEARTHLAADLDRYLFCAAYAEKYGLPARITDFPASLYPNHKNVHNLAPGEEMKFSDRFRVQIWDKPSTTITSHIAKDGHYYIHPDPEQCRSLTVREAARLQTFPDDYYFEGNRTSQYTQVGNAVPPLLAQQIAVIVAKFLNYEAFGFCRELTLEHVCDVTLSDKGTLPCEGASSSEPEL